MSGVLERTLGILELLSEQGQGVELAVLAEQLNMPKSAAHRLLADLVRFGYVRQTRDLGAYVLTTKLVSLGLSYLSKTGVIDVAQPLLDRLAEQTGELVRLSVVDGDRLTWVARAQGARQGLRYDPDMGSIARLSCSSSGLAWLSTMKDDDALALVSQQGLGLPADFGPNAPKSLKAFLKVLHDTRKQGFSLTEETYTAGLNALAAPVGLAGQLPMGTISVAGPSARLTRERMLAIAPDLLSCAAQLAADSGASPMLASGGSKVRLQPIYAA
ncbi:MAG: IclR family transcriptional regulator [Limnohabitans sp.]|nr:IclR family transcriptional regulator [Limnohabitans sp.]